MSGSAHLDLVRWGRQGKGKGEGKGSGREGEGRRKEGGRKHITFIKSRGPDVGGKIQGKCQPPSGMPLEKRCL